MKITDAERIIHEHMNELYDKPCSLGYHLNKRGGLMQHLSNVWRLATKYFADDETLQALGLAHDIGKGRVYGFDSEGGIIFISKVDHIEHTLDMINESGYDLTEEELDAIRYHHGGYVDNYRHIRPKELAIKLHMCDHLSTVMEKNNVMIT